jgi:DNA-binding Lrp family transcriptional regulator
MARSRKAGITTGRYKMGNNEKILALLEQNARLTAEEIAVMTAMPAEAVKQAIAEMEADKVILGYSAAVNWEKTMLDPVTAMIEVRVTPQRDQGFDHIARRIYRFPQVKSCYLMSGGFDLLVIVEDTSLKSVAQFVSEKIAPLDSVISTQTHFILKKYKMNGLEFAVHDDDMREAVVL